MSFLATQWASQQTTDRPADKLVLWAMADAARAERLCFMAVASVIEFTGLDRKTVLAAQARLKERGLIVDTGNRCGATRQVIIWLLPHPEADGDGQSGASATPKRRRNSPEKGIPKTGPLEGNSPVFPFEQSQKGDTEPVSEPIPPDANASEGTRLTRVPAFARPYVEVWNSMADRAGLAKVIAIDDKRAKALKARLRDHGDASFAQAVAAVERSSFCNGTNGRGWQADFTFLLRPGNYLKLIEGGYDAPGEGPAAAGPTLSVEDQAKHFDNTADLMTRLGRHDDAAVARASAAKLRGEAVEPA